MSGDGELFKHNGSVSGQGAIFLPSGNGGGCIKKGPFAGIPYDGKLTLADGKGLWGEGLDPQALYCQSHKPGGLSWDWSAGKCTMPCPPLHAASNFDCI